MNTLRKIYLLQNRGIYNGKILQYIVSPTTYCGHIKDCRISKLCSTHVRETFDEFRAREEQKEKKTLTQNILNSRTEANDKDIKVLVVKESILEAALDYVPSHGWSKNALVKGAESVNYPSVVNGLFPKGGIELLNYFHTHCNKKLADQLKRITSGNNDAQDSAKFARKAIEIRLRMLIPYLQHWPQALGLMSLPPNIPASLAHILTLVDEICYYAGDRSVDFNWYTRRVGLASIYKATELYMLQDNSQDFEKTWKFLGRRVEEARILHDFLIKSEHASVHIQNAVGSTFSTARNILGLNFDRR
nr:ubiquinone biosynthesis protein COQ9, mitochondrial-like isoform X3 [Aedes albopictus]